MQFANQQGIQVEVNELESLFLERIVRVEFFLPSIVTDFAAMDLLLINDGQDMEKLTLADILANMSASISPLLCVGIYAGERTVEYGTAGRLDYLGRGFKAGNYTRFVMEELLPYIYQKFNIASFRRQSFAGFSLGALSALDIVWNHASSFYIAGVFSGSLWWRSKSLTDGYVEDRDRIMHSIIRHGNYAPHLKFFFETGVFDETMDRNNNGIIDSIDDTLGLIAELVDKGYEMPRDIHYLELQEGRHDVATWAKAMPEFLRWGWGK